MSANWTSIVGRMELDSVIRGRWREAWKPCNHTMRVLALGMS